MQITEDTGDSLPPVPTPQLSPPHNCPHPTTAPTQQLSPPHNCPHPTTTHKTAYTNVDNSISFKLSI